MRRVAVIGAGIIGSASAFALARKGWEVTLVDRNARPGEGASASNGAQLTYSHVEPLANPQTLRRLPRWLLEKGSPVSWRPQPRLSHFLWLASFLSCCTASKAAGATASLLELAQSSRRVLREWLPSFTAIELDRVKFATPGKLLIYKDPALRLAAEALVKWRTSLGCEMRVLGANEVLQIEPALANEGKASIAFGLWSPNEEVAEAGELSRLLAIKSGARLVTGRCVSHFVQRGQSVHSVALDDGTEIEADQFVLAAGTQVPSLARMLGVRIPIEPVKGYTVTLDIADVTRAPAVSVTDTARKVVYGRVGDKLRVAGFADLRGDDMSIDRARIRALLAAVDDTFPKARTESSDVRAWTGLRPMTPHGRPYVGSLGSKNVWVNGGHGAYGLTLAAGSAEALAHSMAQTEVDAQLAAFSIS